MIRTIATPTLRDYIALAPHERIAWHTADELIPLADVDARRAGSTRRATFFASAATISSMRAKERARAGAS